MERHILQSLKFEEQEVDLSLLYECFYSESIRIDSPRMKLVFSDFFGVYAQRLKIKYGNKCKAEISDQNTTIQLEFIVLGISSVKKGKAVCYELHLIDSRVFKMMKTLNLPFNGTPKKVILDVCKELDIKTPVLSEDLPKGTWHNLRSQVSNMIRLIAKEIGTLIFFNRKNLICQKFETLENGSKIQMIDSEIQAGKLPILQSKILSQEHAIDNQARQLVGLDEDKGIIKVHGKVSGSQPDLTSIKTPKTLKNSQVYYPNIIEIVTEFSLSVSPGTPLSFEFIKHGKTRAIDETRPTKALAANIVHWTDNKRAITKIFGCEKKVW